jgi:hypothetical protein
MTVALRRLEVRNARTGVARDGGDPAANGARFFDEQLDLSAAGVDDDVSADLGERRREAFGVDARQPFFLTELTQPLSRDDDVGIVGDEDPKMGRPDSLHRGAPAESVK